MAQLCIHSCRPYPCLIPDYSYYPLCSRCRLATVGSLPSLLTRWSGSSLLTRWSSSSLQARHCWFPAAAVDPLVPAPAARYYCFSVLVGTAVPSYCLFYLRVLNYTIFVTVLPYPLVTCDYPCLGGGCPQHRSIPPKQLITVV